MHTVGIVLDLSLRHLDNGNGPRLIDVVKKQLVQFVKSIEDEDSLYLYHAELADLLQRKGEQVAAIGNYETDGYTFDLPSALKQSLYVLAVEDPDFSRHLILFTDRLSSSIGLKKAYNINRKDMIESQIVVVHFGEHLSEELLNDIQSYGAIYHFVSDPEIIADLLKEVIDAQV